MTTQADPVIAGFFRKYGAVMCGEGGTPDYTTARPDALVMHAEGDLKGFRAGAVAETRERLVEIGAELVIRCNALWLKETVGAEREYARLANEITVTVGVEAMSRMYDAAFKSPRYVRRGD